MRTFIPIGVALAVAGLVLVIWGLARDDGGVREVTRRERADASDESSSPGRAAAGASDPSLTGDLPGWIEGLGVPAPVPDEGPDGLPKVVHEIAGLCFGKSWQACNTIEVKSKLIELMDLIDDMGDAEKEALADYFRDCEQPGEKYHLMVALRSRAGDPFVEPVEEYYDVEPHMVAETLQWMVGRTPNAARAFERLLEREADPMRREMLLSRAAFLGTKEVEPMLLEAFDEGQGKSDRRVAVAGMARTPTEETRQRLWNLLDGPREEAVFDVASDGPRDEKFRDLRAHAVAGLLVNGSENEVRRLFDRVRAGRDDDAVAGYVEDLLVAVRTSALVPDAVDLMLSRGEFSQPLFMYIGSRAEPGQVAQMERLLTLDLTDDQRQRLQRVIDRAR